MKILHLIQRPQLRGAEIFATQIAQLHQAAGHEILMLALFGVAKGTPLLDTGSVPLEVLSLKEGRRFVDVGGWKQLAERIRAFDPDIVQANAGDTLKYGVFSRQLFGWPGKLIFRNANLLSLFIRGQLQRAFVGWHVRRVDSVVSVSQRCREDIVRLYPEVAAATVTIPIGTDLSELDSGRRSAPFELPATEPVIVNIGSFVPEKNHEGLLRIFHQLRARTGKGHLLLIGGGKLREQLEEQTRDLGLEEHVTFAGYVENASGLLHLADLMVMPSFIEGLPGVILEAMARSVPVVAANVGGIGEVVRHGYTGYLFEPQDEAAFVAACEELYVNQDKRATLVASARQLIEEKYTIEGIAAEFIKHYQKLSLRDKSSARDQIARPGRRGNAAARDAARP